MNSRAMRAGGWPLRPSSRPFLLLSLLLILVSLLTACSPSTTGKKSPASTPTPTWPPLPTATPGPATLQQAWGNVTITKIPTSLPDNRVFIYQPVATTDGQWIVGVDQPRDFLVNTIRPSYLALYNVHTRAVKRLHALLHVQSQVIGASTDGAWLVWSEADDQPNFFDWTTFLYDLNTGAMRELAQAPRINGQAVHGPNTPAIVSNNHVIWSEALAPIQQGNDTSLQNAVVRIEDLATGQITTLATKAGQSNLSWPWACWDQITSGSNGYVEFKNLVTGQQEQLQAQPSALGLHGVSVTFDSKSISGNNGGYINLLDDVSKSVSNMQVVATAGASQQLEYPSLNDRLVAWVQSSTQPEVWDRVQHRLIILPVFNGVSDTWVSGQILGWNDPEPSAQATADEQHNLIPTPTLYIVNTATLPAMAPGG